MPIEACSSRSPVTRWKRIPSASSVRNAAMPHARSAGCTTSCFATLRSVKPSGAVLFANGVKALGDLDLVTGGPLELGGRAR